MLKDKALTSLAAGESLLAGGFSNDAASRLYYAMYQAAVHALTQRGRRPEQTRSGAVDWDHSMVENNVRTLRGSRADKDLYRAMRSLRVAADYAPDYIRGADVIERHAAVSRFVKELTA